MHEKTEEIILSRLCRERLSLKDKFHSSDPRFARHVVIDDLLPSETVERVYNFIAPVLNYTLGIDASNIRSGGAFTHIVQILGLVNPAEHGVGQIWIWGGIKLLDQLPSRSWLKKCCIPALDKSLTFRIFWQQFELPKAIQAAKCHVLLSPGGLVPWHCPIPTVVMSQNLLPFVKKEIRLSPLLSRDRLRLTLLRYAQMNSMRKASGIIFLTEYAQNIVLSELKNYSGPRSIISHGIENRFFSVPKQQKSLAAYSLTQPFRFLYVSTVFYYKHQWQVAKAVANLRKRGFPVVIDFIGGGDKAAKQLLRKTIGNLDPEGVFLRYHDQVSFDKLPLIYKEADAFVYASTCETFGSIILEAMASGLPIASSHKGPMPELLGDSAFYFDVECRNAIEVVLEKLLNSFNLRERYSQSAYQRAQQYSWDRCARETFSFISRVANPQCGPYVNEPGSYSMKKI